MDPTQTAPGADGDRDGAAAAAHAPPEQDVPPEQDERFRPVVPAGAPDLLARRTASWLVPALVATARRLEAAGEDLHPPAPHPSLALAVLEAVWTPRVDAATTDRVVRRFRESHPPGAGADVLVAAVRDAGGDEAWARARATRHRARPALDAPLKATAAREGAQVLLDHGIRSCEELVELLDAARAEPDPAAQDPDAWPTAEQDLSRDPALRAARDRWDAVRAAWRAVPGQASGRSWHRLLVLAGAQRVVPDDDVRRFASRWHRGPRAAAAAAGRSAPPRAGSAPDVWVAARLLDLAADLAQASPREVDHLAWRGELLRTGSRRGAGAADPVAGALVAP
ncbi:hypothetical protein [uncultured Pseudokineococcus sp.]|uniref:hypothetical protein n=1 Tax=uncultured Pseudokineococcus sp. TaxID=1642928 RepID=UPI00262EF6D5|nr:hypothetical protein [uncultured Pseudokineococcus sp.]